MHSKWFFLLLLCVEFLAHPALAREDASLPKVSSGRIERLQQLEFRDIQSRAVGVWTPPDYRCRSVRHAVHARWTNAVRRREQLEPTGVAR